MILQRAKTTEKRITTVTANVYIKIINALAQNMKSMHFGKLGNL